MKIGEQEFSFTILASQQRFITESYGRKYSLEKNPIKSTLKDTYELFQERQHPFCLMYICDIDWLINNNHQETYFKTNYSKNSKIKYPATT